MTRIDSMAYRRWWMELGLELFEFWLELLLTYWGDWYGF